jgi:hypothetical protein
MVKASERPTSTGELAGSGHRALLGRDDLLGQLGSAPITLGGSPRTPRRWPAWSQNRPSKPARRCRPMTERRRRLGSSSSTSSARCCWRRRRPRRWSWSPRQPAVGRRRVAAPVALPGPAPPRGRHPRDRHLPRRRPRPGRSPGGAAGRPRRRPPGPPGDRTLRGGRRQSDRPGHGRHPRGGTDRGRAPAYRREPLLRPPGDPPAASRGRIVPATVGGAPSAIPAGIREAVDLVGDLGVEAGGVGHRAERLRATLDLPNSSARRTGPAGRWSATRGW